MKSHFDLPGVSCEKCKGKLDLHIETKGTSISTLKIKCKQCDWDEDILEKSGEAYEAGKKQFRGAIAEIVKALLKLKESLPKNTDEWAQIVKNPKHPFTATLLVGLALILMEASGFGIFLALTWILSNLILNPVGWVLIPLIVAIGFTYRRFFKQDKLKKLKARLTDVEQRKDAGEISQEDYETEKNKLLQDFFGE